MNRKSNYAEQTGLAYRLFSFPMIMALACFFCSGEPVLSWSYQGTAAMGASVLPREIQASSQESLRWELIPRNQATVKDAMVRVSDLFQVIPAGNDEDLDEQALSKVEEVILTTAPAPGTERRIDPSLVYYRLRLAGISASMFSWRGEPGSLTVAAGSRVVEESEIAQAIREYLSANLKNSDYQADFQVQGRRVIIPDCGYLIRVEGLEEAGSGFNRARVRILDMSGNNLASLIVKVSLSVFRDVVVATRSIEIGEELGPGNISLERRRVLTWKNDYIIDAALPTGKVASKRIGAGTALSDDMFREQTMVKANSEVTIISVCGSVSISLKGKALDTGAMNEKVRVLNPESRKMFTAMVVGKDTVEVR